MLQALITLIIFEIASISCAIAFLIMNKMGKF